METTTYKVTYLETHDEWVFKYDLNGMLVFFENIQGNKILDLFLKNQFPFTESMVQAWHKYKKLIKIEIILSDLSFEAFWKKYNLKVKKEAAQKAYAKLNDAEILLCFQNLKNYEDHLVKTGQAKAHLVTWLNGKRYFDEY
jgi:hypothetical protein